MLLAAEQYQLALFILANQPAAIPADQKQTLEQLRDLGHVAFNHGRLVITGRGGCALRRSGYMGSLDGQVIQPTTENGAALPQVIERKKMGILTALQFEALKQFVGVRVLTETSMARALQCEKVKARSLIRTLSDKGMIAEPEQGSFELLTDGEQYLISRGIDVKPKKKPADTIETLEALDLPPSNAEPQIKPEDIPSFGSISKKTIQEWAEASKAIEPTPGRPDFTALVRQGLERLNRQLGIVQHEIEDIDLKIETLAKLSASVESISQEMAVILRATAKDLHRIKYGK